MKHRNIPLLGYALLGLLHQKPRSGYDLRKVFAETAMGNYSNSPGAIYPALQRLERDAFVSGKVEATAGLRQRCVYRVTKKGMAALNHWLTDPIKPSDVQRGAGELMLRFSFMEQVCGSSGCITFLNSFRAMLEPYIGELEAYLKAQAESMPLSGRLALESGIRGYRTLHEWTGYALDAYRRQQFHAKAQIIETRTGDSQ